MNGREIYLTIIIRARILVFASYMPHILLEALLNSARQRKQ